MKDRRRGLDPAEFLARMGAVRRMGIVALIALAAVGALHLIG